MRTMVGGFIQFLHLFHNIAHEDYIRVVSLPLFDIWTRGLISQGDYFWWMESELLSHCLLLDAAGSVNISNILTGKCLAKITATRSCPKVNECSSSAGSSKQPDHYRVRSTVAEALEDITALFYDEERNEIYTGNRHGLVHVWSNWNLGCSLICCGRYKIALPEDWFFIWLALYHISSWDNVRALPLFTRLSKWSCIVSFDLWGYVQIFCRFVFLGVGGCLVAMRRFLYKSSN